MRSITIVFAASILLGTILGAQTTSDYDLKVQKGKSQLQAGSADAALASAEEAIKQNADRWEGYALAGGALMNLKRYEEAADKLSKAIDRAPEPKQPALRDLRRHCLLAESGTSSASKESASATTQAEIVLWKSIENSANAADFQTYLDQYPHGAFVALAERHLSEIREQTERDREIHGAELPTTIWLGSLIALKPPPGELQEGSGIFVFSSQVDIRYRRLPEKELTRAVSDAKSLKYDEFLRKYFAQSQTGSSFDIVTAKWRAEGPQIIFTVEGHEFADYRDGDKDCRAQTQFVGSRGPDSMEGNWTYLGTKGFLSNCSPLHGTWQLKRIASRDGALN